MPGRRLVLAVLLLALVAPPVTAGAQEPFPSRPITIVAPFPPGGVADLTARPVAAAMEKVLKSPVGVVNKTGAAGAVGMQSVAVAKPDGYTLLLALSSISIIPEADKLFGRPPAFTVDQFAPIALISADPTILVVPADKPWRTAREFIEDAKQRPGQISYSSSGIYGTLHMAMELLSQAADIKLRHVPHAGGGPALTAVLGGHVDALASGPSVVLPHIKSGKLRVLGGWGDKRLAALPDVPTFKELGYPTAEFYIWAGLFAPRATPEPVLAKLRATVREAVEDPDFKTAMDKLQTPVNFKQGAEFQAFF
jgi:tripartite-type tricarboxylate transporter receptor subunit TctC